MLRFVFSKTFLIQVVLAVVFITLVIIGAYFFLINYAKTGEAVSVPALENLDIIEADAELKQLELNVEIIDSIYQQDKRGGIVVDQNPVEGSMVKKGRKIYLTISRYDIPTVEVPNVLNQTTAIAISKLTRRGFKIGELTSKSDPCDGCAIGLEFDGKTVDVGSKIPSGSTVNIIVGQQNDGAISLVPALYGLTKDEATALLHQHELNRGAYVYDLESVKSEGDSLAARVYSQSIAPSENAKVGTPINISLTIDMAKIPEANLDSIKASIQ